MKLLKKALLYILPAVMAGGAVSSCSDFIDIQPENKLPEENIDYTKSEEMYQPVVGAYYALRNNAIGLAWCSKLLTFTRDGDVWSGRVDDQGACATFGRQYQYDNSFWGLNETWANNWYKLIIDSNSSLAALDNYGQHLTPGSETYRLYESYAGEIRTLRAWAYYMLVTNFGPVPIYRDMTQTEFRRATVESVYKYMLEELEWCASKMERKRPNQMTHQGAVTAFTAEMIAARVHMLMENWSEVERLTDDIIKNGGFKLYDDFYNLFKIPGKLCDESLFECQTTDYGNGSGSQLGVDNWFVAGGPSLSNSDLGINIGGWTFLGYEDSFVAWAENRGETVRAVTSFLKGGTTTPSGDYVNPRYNPGETGPNTNCWNGKDYLPIDQLTPGRTEYGCNNNVRILRYAEVLLMNSEAKVRQGKNGDAPFNEVRRRAKMAELNGVTVNDILDERRMELCCEWGIRYTDLWRTGLAASVLGPKGWTPEKTYWPVPLNQLQTIPTLRLDPVEE